MRIRTFCLLLLFSVAFLFPSFIYASELNIYRHESRKVLKAFGGSLKKQLMKNFKTKYIISILTLILILIPIVSNGEENIFKGYVKISMGSNMTELQAIELAKIQAERDASEKAGIPPPASGFPPASKQERYMDCSRCCGTLPR